MSVTITLEDIQAYAEVDYIINHMNKKYIDKVPDKLLNFFADYKDPNLEVKVNPYVPLQNQGLKRYTLEILALLHLKYWCEDEERKQQLYDLMVSNQSKLEEQMREKYSVEKLFDNASATVVKDESDLDDDIDYSKPKAVQRYSNYAENNDIQDYTDTVEETETAKPVEENMSVAKVAEESLSFFAKLKLKFMALFGKSNG